MRLSFSNKVCNLHAVKLFSVLMGILLTVLAWPVHAQEESVANTPAIMLDVAPEDKKEAAPKTKPAVVKTDAKEADIPDVVPDVVFDGNNLTQDEELEKDTPLPKVKSLFFSIREMNSIRKSAGVYKRVTGAGSNGMDFLKRLQEKKKPKKNVRYFVYPQFFLASLVYNDEKDWTVHINEQVLSYKKPEGLSGIRIKSIDKDSVTIEWMPDDWRKIEEVWSTISEKSKSVIVNTRQGIVTFTIRPNQTFSSYVMRVLEGKVMPMVLDLKPKKKKDGKVGITGNNPAAPGAPTERDFLDSILGRAR